MKQAGNHDTQVKDPGHAVKQGLRLLCDEPFAALTYHQVQQIREALHVGMHAFLELERVHGEQERLASRDDVPAQCRALSVGDDQDMRDMIAALRSID